jgi:hypothetical protein
MSQPARSSAPGSALPNVPRAPNTTAIGRAVITSS